MGPAVIKDYLVRRGRAPMMDLVNRFDSDPRALEGVLEFWMQRGRVRRLPGVVAGNCAGGCGQDCGVAARAPDLTVVYEWVGTAQPLCFVPVGQWRSERRG
ncbi:FeoC-like transcriptional regulator [Acidihalobacter prosperus]|uniref:Transcriptional regulator HTH-type FeoC domain-containing protein n=1 Tax=Acidihalobacter prosperus TaxID=160660 RepID=A0A1A6C1U6_9GAMM|nr:FeoC-like transcriptional regulator [Acidihalobacter prosperus]OBS08524.1 hypothetical protein Thpro_022774 [Acidihalobacter prosperus]